MSKARFTIKKGELAQMKTTGEPVFITALYQKDNEEYAIINRPVITSEGVRHSQEDVSVELLETRFEQAKRNVEYENFVQDLRDEATNKRYALSTASREILAANGPLPFRGNSDPTVNPRS